MITLENLKKTGIGEQELSGIQDKQKALILRDVKKKYSDEFCLDIDGLTFAGGRVYVIMGPNGSGKSSLLNVAGLLERPDEGEVLLEGYAGLSVSGKIWEKRRRIGFVMQESYLFDNSVYYNVAYGLKIRRVGRKEMDRRVSAALDEVGIAHLKDRNVKKLSGGEKKRVSIAQVLALDAEIILMDEPMAQVDKVTVGIIERLIRDLRNKQDKTIIITTHSVNQAYRLSGDIISLKSGRISDFVHENVFYGNIRSAGEGIGVMTVTDGVDIHLIPEELGQAYIAVDPESILLSRESLDSSARNFFRGRITRVEDLGVNIRVFVDCGVELCSLITRRSYMRMGLNIGSFVYLNFKVNSVKVI